MWKKNNRHFLTVWFCRNAENHTKINDITSENLIASHESIHRKATETGRKYTAQNKYSIGILRCQKINVRPKIPVFVVYGHVPKKTTTKKLFNKPQVIGEF